MSSTPLCLVTSGPAYSPVDEVRRITNVSSGELGSLLSETLMAAGCDVVCFSGEMAARRPKGVRIIPFSTNDSLAAALTGFEPAYVFHAAALCDFEVAATDVSETRKIRSDLPSLTITLHPAGKLLPTLPALFPGARIVGWKYEMDGTQADAIARGRRQIREAGTIACVVNGAAYGPGFGFLDGAEAEPVHYPDKAALCAGLAEWVRRR